MSKTGINWEAVREKLDGEEWEEVETDREERTLYLGSVMSLTPSGKVYTPWACSNVEACKACQEALDGPCDDTSRCTGSTGDPLEGEGHCEVCRDAAWNKLLEEEASEHGLYITSGEGDMCDILVGESRDKGEE